MAYRGGIALSGYAIAVIVTHAINLVLVLVAAALYRSHLAWRASRNRMTRFGPYAYFVALLAAFIEFVMVIAFTILVSSSPSSAGSSSTTAYFQTLLSLSVVWDFAAGISGIFALVVIGSFVQDWTDGVKRKSEDVCIRVAAWLLFLLVLVNLGFDITFAVIEGNEVHYIYRSYGAASYDATYGDLANIAYTGYPGIRACVDCAYNGIALIYLIGFFVVAIKNYNTFRAYQAYRSLTVTAIILAIAIFALSLADNAVWISPDSYVESRYYAYIKPSVAYYEVVAPILDDVLYAILLLILAFISRAGAGAIKHVDATETTERPYPGQDTHVTYM